MVDALAASKSDQQEDYIALKRQVNRQTRQTIDQMIIDFSLKYEGMDRRLHEMKQNLIDDYVDERHLVWKNNLDEYGYESTMGVDEYQDELKKLEQRKNVTADSLTETDLKIDFEHFRYRNDSKIYEGSKASKPALSRASSQLSIVSIAVATPESKIQRSKFE